MSAFLDDLGNPKGLAKALLARNHTVLLVEPFLTGWVLTNSAGEPDLAGLRRRMADLHREHHQGFFPTYDRTDLQERVQDLITACAFAQAHGKGRKVVLCGNRSAGLWALLAAPAADAVIADCSNLDHTDDRDLEEQYLYVPGIRKIGGFAGVAALAAPNPLLLHYTGPEFYNVGDAISMLKDTYAAAGSKNLFKTDTFMLSDERIVDWISALK